MTWIHFLWSGNASVSNELSQVNKGSCEALLKFLHAQEPVLGPNNHHVVEVGILRINCGKGHLGIFDIGFYQFCESNAKKEGFHFFGPIKFCSEKVLRTHWKP